MAGRRKKFLGFGQTKAIKFDTLSMIHTLRAVYFETFFHLHNTLGMSWKTKKSLLLLKGKNVHIWLPANLENALYSRQEQFMSITVQSCSIVFYFILSTVLQENIIYILYILSGHLKNQVFNVWSICFRYHENLTNKQNTTITTNKEFLGTYIKSKNNSIYTVYTHN